MGSSRAGQQRPHPCASAPAAPAGPQRGFLAARRRCGAGRKRPAPRRAPRSCCSPADSHTISPRRAFLLSRALSSGPDAFILGALLGKVLVNATAKRCPHRHHTPLARPSCLSVHSLNRSARGERSRLRAGHWDTHRVSLLAASPLQGERSIRSKQMDTMHGIALDGGAQGHRNGDRQSCDGGGRAAGHLPP